ncbi:SAM-dependent methyltransferase [Amycolatopsis sp. NPDC051758]|uniref:SAM-dependent methyltransferase n=1 Tax=Amycolatopsis sp. NPDC051758 TaxID=3363935 RepID=UPI0037BDA78E
MTGDKWYPTTPRRPGDPDVDVESPRRDPVGDYLLGGSIKSAVDRDFAAGLVAAYPQLPRLAATAARWDRDAAQLMLDQSIGHFLILGTGGMPLWANHAALASLHTARARIVVLEHDPVTRHLHDFVDGGAAADRALVLHVPAERHHVLPQLPEVAELLACGAPVGVLATALLRPAGITLATILSLLTVAPPGSQQALTQLTIGHSDDDVAEVAARFADAGIPIAVAAPGALDATIAAFQLRGTVDEGDAAAMPSPSTAPGVQTVLLTARTVTANGQSR